MKKFFIFVATAFAFAACEGPEQSSTSDAVSEIIVTPSTCEVLIGESIDLSVEVTPAK